MAMLVGVPVPVSVNTPLYLSSTVASISESGYVTMVSFSRYWFSSLSVALMREEEEDLGSLHNSRMLASGRFSLMYSSCSLALAPASSDDLRAGNWFRTVFRSSLDRQNTKHTVFAFTLPVRVSFLSRPISRE